MILKKPYAFLIKYFRIIHLILALPMIYLIYKTTNIVSFFNDFVNNNYSLTVNGELAPMFISGLMYFGIILIILSAIAVYLLFKYKKKPRNHYIAIIIYYLILFILLSVCHNILDVMETEVIEASIARSYRDISMLVVIPQFYFCGFALLRGLGFNIKKLNFADDLKEMEISDKDSEEFEFLVGVEGYKAKRTIRRFFREFSYYIKENTFIFITIVLLAIIGIGTSIYLNKDKYEVEYKLGEVFNYKTFSVSVEDAITTNLAYNGTLISKDKHYLILKLKIKNNLNQSNKINHTDFKILLNNEYKYPILDKANYFADYAIPYIGGELKGLEENSYLLVYELMEAELKEEYLLKIYNGISVDKGKYNSKYSNITLNPLLVEKKAEVKNVGLAEKLDLSNSNIGKTSLMINDYHLTNKYVYNYESCSTYKCTSYTDFVSVDYFTNASGNTLLVLNYEMLLDTDSAYSSFIKSEKSFFNNFASIRYKIGETEYTQVPTNKTPNNLKNILVFQVSDQIKNATEIDFLITVRNKIYSVTLK